MVLETEKKMIEDASKDNFAALNDLLRVLNGYGEQGAINIKIYAENVAGSDEKSHTGRVQR